MAYTSVVCIQYFLLTPIFLIHTIYSVYYSNYFYTVVFNLLIYFVGSIISRIYFLFVEINMTKCICFYFRTMLSPMLKPRHQTHRKQSSASSISSYSNTPRKKKPAPLPPKSKPSLDCSNSMQTSSPNSLDDSSCSGSEPSSAPSNQENYRLHKSIHGKWKRKKGPAPQCPIPQRRRIKPMPMEDIKQELLDIEIKQQELERQGVKLEKDIRLKCNEGML